MRELRDILQGIAANTKNQAGIFPTPTLALVPAPGSISKTGGGIFDDHGGCFFGSHYELVDWLFARGRMTGSARECSLKG